MINVTVIQGRFTKDPELRYTQSQTPVLSFSLACQRNVKTSGDPDYPVDFLDCVAWRQTAEFISKYFRKGSMIICRGRLQKREWTDQNGNKRNTTEIVIDEASFCEKKQEGGGQGGSYGQPQGGYGGSYGQSYAQPPQSYGQAQNVYAPPQGYAVPSQGYQQPGYGAPSMGGSQFQDIPDDGELPF